MADFEAQRKNLLALCEGVIANPTSITEAQSMIDQSYNAYSRRLRMIKSLVEDEAQSIDDRLATLTQLLTEYQQEPVP